MNGGAPTENQIIPISYATGTLDATTVEVVVPAATTMVSVWADQAYQVAINDGTDLNLTTSNANAFPANYVSYFPVNRNRRGVITTVQIERLSVSGTYVVNFSK